MMRIDGSYGEGGGQILRTALAMATLLGQPVEIENIRANRKKPGLRPQHLEAVKALAAISAADMEGVFENSRHLSFMPRTLKGGRYRFVIATAGSATLLFAAILPPLLFAPGPSQIIIRGGTHVPFSPPYHYLEWVFLPALQRLGAQVRVSLVKWGWYPAGGGEIHAEIVPGGGLSCLRLDSRGPLQRLELTAVLANLPLHIAEREQDYVKKRLSRSSFEVLSHFLPAPSPGQGNMVFLQAEFAETRAGFSALGRKGKPAEDVAEDVCRDWLAFVRSGASVDLHLADQLVPYLALARGISCLSAEKVTGHLLTNIRIVEQFLPVRFKLAPATGRLEVKGVGFSRPSTCTVVRGCTEQRNRESTK